MDSVGLYAMNAKQAKATTMRQARVRPVRTRTSMMLLLTRLPVPHKSAPTVKALQATAHRGSQVVELLTALSVAPATIRLLERGSAQKTRVRVMTERARPGRPARTTMMQRVQLA